MKHWIVVLEYLLYLRRFYFEYNIDKEKQLFAFYGNPNKQMILFTPA